VRSASVAIGSEGAHAAMRKTAATNRRRIMFTDHGRPDQAGGRSNRSRISHTG
jgi:hypothetical protein